MERNNTIYGVMCVVVGIILLGSLLIPILNDGQQQIKTTFINGVGGYVQDGEDDYTLETNKHYANFKINGETVDITGWTTLLFTDKCRVVNNGHFIQVFDENTSRIWNINSQNYLHIIQYVASTKTLTVTAYEGQTVDTGVRQTVSYTVENIVYLIPNGDYTAIDTTTDAKYYVTDLNQIIAGGAYTTGSLVTSYITAGTSAYFGKEGYTGSASITGAEVSNYKGLLECEDYTVTVTDGTTTESFEPFTVFVPAKVVIYSDELNGLDGLFSAIPLIILIAILSGLAVVVVRHKDN